MDKPATSKFNLHLAALAGPSLLMLLVASVWSDHASQAVTLAGVAFSIGFGASKQLFASRWIAMAVAGAGMAIASAIGTMVGDSSSNLLIGCGVVCAAVGWLVHRGESPWWVSLQCAITFLLASQAPGDLSQAMARLGLVCLGAALQMAAIWLLICLGDRIGPPSDQALEPQGDSTAAWLFAARVSLCGMFALLLARYVGLSHSYWAPMTVLIVSKPELSGTVLRDVERLIGTLIGVIAATVVVHSLSSHQAVVAVLAVSAAALAYGLQQARYLYLTTAITTCVVLMLWLSGAKAPQTQGDRLLSTLIGGGVALAGSLLAQPLTSKRSDCGS